MPRRVEALIKPELLIWARESAGFTLADAARKAKVNPEKLEQWEDGRARPTIPQLRELARIYKRPLAVFYLPVPPKDFQPMNDYRRLPGEAPLKQSPTLRYETRHAHYRREAALELYEEIGETPPTFAISATLREDSETLATRLRQLLGITYEDQITWKDGYDALNHWRTALERVGVLVFQVSGIKLNEMRGFSISDLPLPVIAVNSRDNPRARVFTLLHEFVHIALQKGGLCEWDIDANAGVADEAQGIEVFCNRVAGAMLVPGESLLQDEVVVRNQGRADWSSDMITQLVNRYNANREVILRRLLALGRTTPEFYQRKRDEFQKAYASYQKPVKGFALPHQKTLANAGTLFVNLVLSSYHQEKITASDLSDLLEVRLQHVPKIEKVIFGRAAGAAA